MQHCLRRCTSLIFPLFIFSLISIAYFGLDVIGHLKTSYIGTSGDSTAIIWAFAWWKHCLQHGIIPFFNTTVWYPYTYNLTHQNIITWGNVLVTAPILFWFGPVVAYNISMLVAPALSAWTAFILLRYLTKTYWPAFFGAYFYGFSSYIIGHMLGHLMLVTVYLIPLIVLLTIKFYRNEISRVFFCFWISLCLALQFYINTELFATTVVFGALSLLLVLLIFKDSIAIKRTVLFLCVALVVTLVLISPYLYLFLLPPKLDASIFPPSAAFVSDLLQPYIPSQIFMLHLNLNQYYINAIKYGAGGIVDVAEYNCYFGIPLVTLCWLYYFEFYKSKIAQFCMLSIVIIFICALGSRLHVFGIRLFPMPWGFTKYLPFIKFALPVRFGLYISLGVATIVAFWLANSKVNKYIKCGLVALSILFLIPTLNYSTRHWSQTTTVVPTLISKGLYKQWLKPGDVVVILPYATIGEAMLWQFQSDMYFKMAGGYLGYTPPEFAQNQTAQAFWQYSTTPNLTLASQPKLLQSTKQFLIDHQVKAIFVYQNLPTWELFFAKLGMKPINVDGVDVFLTNKQRN